MDATSDTFSRFFKAYATNEDGTIQQPPTRIKFTFGRDALIDHSGAAPIPHPLAQASSKILDYHLFRNIMDYLTNRTTVDWFTNLKLNLNSNWAQTSLLMASKFRKTNIMSIIEQQTGLPTCGPPVIDPIDASITLIDFSQAERDTEIEKFQEATDIWNQINNTVCDLLISSIENSHGKNRESLFPIMNTNNFLNRAGVYSSSIYASLHKHFVESMGTCEQIKAKCQTLRMRIPADATISMVNSDLMLLFNDYRYRDVLNRELLESEKIAYLATVFEFSRDQRLKQCSEQISLKNFTGAITYEEAITELTHVENSIRTIKMNMNLTSSLSNQYTLLNDHQMASSLIHHHHLQEIQSTRKRRIRQPSRLEVSQLQRMYEDPDPPARMNRYGYDGPNRHQYGGNKIPIPARFFNPQSPQPRYPAIDMQSAPSPPRSPPPQHFSSNRGQNNNTSLSQNSHRNNTNSNSRSDPQVNVTFSPDSYTPHTSPSNNQHSRNTHGRGRNNGHQGRGHGRSRNVTRDKGNTETRWTRDGQNMIEDSPTPVSTATTDNFTILDDDQPIIAVSSEEEKYLICDSAASRNNISLGSTDVQDFITSEESLLTARIGTSLTVIGNGTIGLLGEVKVIPASQLSKNIMSCGVMSRRGFAFFIRAYGGDCLIRYYLPDDDSDDLSAGYPLTTAKLVTNNLYICLLEVFKQSMSQLTHKAKLYRDQRYKDQGVPRSLYQRTAFQQDNTMVTTLSPAEYFDALDRLPDPTYGETSSERLASIIAMANSLTEEDRVLVTYERGARPRPPHSPHRYTFAILEALNSTTQCLRAMHDVEVSRRSDDTRVHRSPARNSPPRTMNNRCSQPHGQQGQHHYRRPISLNRFPPARGPRVPPPYPHARPPQPQLPQRMFTHGPNMPTQARCARTPPPLRRLNCYNHRLRTRGLRVPPPHLQAPHPRPQPPQCTNIHHPTVNVPAPAHGTSVSPPYFHTSSARGTRVLPSYPHAPIQPPQQRVPGTQAPSGILPVTRCLNPQCPINQSLYTRNQQATLNELFRVDQCNIVQIDDPDFDTAFHDPYFCNDVCNMINLDATPNHEVSGNTVLYAASAKIVDTVRADHEHLGHIPLLQLLKMIQSNLISPHGTSDRAQLLSTFNQIKAAISKGFFCPTCAIVKNARRTPAPRIFPKATVYGGLISTDISGPYAQVGPTQNNMAHWYHDHATKYAWIYHYQTGTAKAIDHLKLLITLEFSGDTKLIAYHADGGKNLISMDTRDFLTTNGTTYTWSPAYKQSMNGSAERLIGIVDTYAACLLHDSGRPLIFREWAQTYATVLYNIRPTSTVYGFMSPFEAKYRNRFDYKLLRKFGCNGYIHMGYELEKGEKDLSPKSQLGIYIGITYPIFQGWLFYMPDSSRIGRIYVGIDVTWNELIPLNESTYFQPLESILDVMSPSKSKSVTDFEYLIGLTHMDNNMLFKVTRVGKSHGFIVAWRKPVFSPDQYRREEETPIHVRDIEALMATYYAHLANYDLQNDPDESPPPRVDTETRRSKRIKQSRLVNTTSHTLATIDSDSADDIFSIQQFQADCINIVKTDGEYKVPLSPKMASKSPQADLWAASQTKEIQGHLSKGSLVVLPLPSSRPHTVKGKWTYKVKNANLDPLFKSRLTAKGFMQIEGLHYNETFASTAQHEVIRIFLVLVAYFKLHLSQLDFELAFLNSELAEEIWMDIDDPVADLRRLFNIPPDHGLRIMKCIYGLKQASREWQLLLDSFLVSYNFTMYQAKDGIGIYVSFADPRGPILILVYVDDLLIGTTTVNQKDDIIAFLKSQATCTDMGPVTTFIGLQINYDRESGSIKLSMSNSIALMLQKLKLTDIRPRVRPGDQHAIQPDTYDFDNEYGPSVVDINTPPRQILSDTEITKYQSMVGALIYIMICLRADIAYSVLILTTFMTKPCKVCWQKALHVVAYLKHTADLYLEYKPTDLLIKFFTDSNFGSDDLLCSKATIGHNGYLGGCLICWKSFKHKMDFSTCVTEYMGFVIAGKRILFIRALLRALSIEIYQSIDPLFIDGIEQEDISPCLVGPSVLFSDNEAAINLSYNPVLHQRTSHVNRLYHGIRTWIKHRVITVQKVPTGLNDADIQTKCSPSATFVSNRNQMGFHSSTDNTDGLSD